MGRESDGQGSPQQESSYFATRRRFLNAPWESKQLTLGDVRRAGWELAGNPNDLRLFGMVPLAWHCLGIRIRGRTAVELTRDGHAEFLGRSVANTLAKIGVRVSDVIDPFVGSGNLLFHVARATKATRAIGLDNSGDVMNLIRRNFARLRVFGRLRIDDLQLHQGNWTECDAYIEDRPTLFIVDPRWGDAFDARGLDLRKTVPPITEVLESLLKKVTATPMFAMLKIHPLMAQGSMEDIKQIYVSFPSAKSDNPDTASRVDYLLLRLR